MELSPEFLLAHPEIVTPSAPWCVALDDLELAALLLAQPWVAGNGLRRADLERQLARLGAELPLGPVYFQRVNRAVARLESVGAVVATGSGRSRRFLATPAGFAALLLNLRVLRDDPTIDGGEFELKRALLAFANLVLEQMARLPGDGARPPGAERFLDDADQITVLGQRVVTERLVGETLDVLRLVTAQRELIMRRLDEVRERLRQVETHARTLRSVDLARREGGSHDGAAEPLGRTSGAPGTAAALAAGLLPQLALRAAALRYERYRQYLDALTTLYTAELKTVDLTRLRAMLERRGA